MSVIQVTNGEDVGAEKGSTQLRPQRFPKTSRSGGAKQKAACAAFERELISGDGGNRTRVRKIRPPDVYKLSRPI